MENETYSLNERQGTMIVKLAAKARVDAAIMLHHQLLQGNLQQHVAVDWSEADHVDASVLQVLLGLQRSLSERGFSLTVALDNERVREYLQYSGLSECFPVKPLPAAGAEMPSHV